MMDRRINRRIKMSETLPLILALLAGTLLGMIFFGGLWWTIQRGISSKQPAALFFFSLLLRTGIALAGFYFVARGDWRRVLACLVGFFLARILVTCLVRIPMAKTKKAQSVGEVCR
jgi:F1F0 ATPase subunit 2